MGRLGIKGFCSFAALLVCLAPLRAQTWHPQPSAAQVTVAMKNASGESMGTASLAPAATGGVQITLDLKGLTPGPHAIHFHQHGRCEPPLFATAGAHFNPEKRKHGLSNPDGPHAGDIPDFQVLSDGTAKSTVIAPAMTYSEGPHSIFSNGGTALIIHAQADDMKSDPSGNSGARIACGVITKPK